MWKHAIKLSTMWCLSYIMCHVGYEFDVDKSKLRAYGKDYMIAMTAAGFPWIFVALWFMFALPVPLAWGDALIAARFAAPTSAGILFSMLEAAGMKETWLFQKARTLAIFDDLDTILLSNSHAEGAQTCGRAAPAHACMPRLCACTAPHLCVPLRSLRALTSALTGPPAVFDLAFTAPLQWCRSK